MTPKQKPRREPFVVVVGPCRSRGGITSVIAAHSATEAWSKYRCKTLNTFTDGRALDKLCSAVGSYCISLAALSSCSIVHFHTAGRSSMLRKLPLLSLASLMGKKCVVHVHAPSVNALFGSRPKSLFRLICALADRVVALSPWWASQFRSLGVTVPITVIPNPVTIPDDIAARRNNSNQRVLFVGKLESRKGYADLIRAAALVLRELPNTKFDMVGHGETDKARALAQSLGIESSIILTGWQQGEALARLYQRATVFCLPSYDEGLPMSLLEAMSWGLPAVTTPVGGIPDLITHGQNGILVSAGQVEELAANLIKLLRPPANDRDRLGAAARRQVQQQCGLAVVSRELEALYEDLGFPLHGLNKPWLNEDFRYFGRPSPKSESLERPRN